MRTTKTLIRLRGCAVWLEFSLGIHVRRYFSYVEIHISILIYNLIIKYVYSEQTLFPLQGIFDTDECTSSEINNDIKLWVFLRWKTNWENPTFFVLFFLFFFFVFFFEWEQQWVFHVDRNAILGLYCFEKGQILVAYQIKWRCSLNI